jgi:cell division protein ZapE
MPNTLARYERLIEARELRADPEQRAGARRLSRLQEELEAVPRRGSLLWRLGRAKPNAPKGVYLWGGVGRGKSMLMDLFYASLKIERKRRVHFHEFMIEVHDRLRIERMKERGDPIPPVVAGIADEATVLAFDEMVINNSADAMIMSRLFTGLIEAGVSVVTTSNRPPADLYKDGLNREHFLPFIALISARLDVIGLNGPIDYRVARMAGITSWHVPNGAEATAAVREAFFKMTDFSPDDAANVPTGEVVLSGNRTLQVPKSLKGVAVFSFSRLCKEARGAADYLAIARTYHTVFMVGIPKLGPENRNEAARFVTFIDALYEHKVKLIATADAQPADLYAAGDGKFEFERTVSRLIEMQSQDYLALGHGTCSETRL